VNTQIISGVLARLMAAGAVVAGRQAPATVAPDPSTQEPPHRTTFEQVNGWTSSLSKFAETEKQADNFNFGETKHEMVTRLFALDKVAYGLHDGTNSHLDALCHYALQRDGKAVVFNGHPQDLDEKGCKANAIDRMGPGIVTRAVLVDLPLMKGVPYLEPRTPVYVSDLQAWEQ
jgi:hypothetical protein